MNPAGMRVHKLVASTIPRSGHERIYSTMIFVDALGTGALFSTAVIYFNAVGHFSAARIGVALTVASFIGLAGAMPFGAAGDRVGHREIVVALCAARGVLYFTLLYVREYGELIVVLSLIELADVGATPCRRAYLADLVGPERRVQANAYNRAVFNLGLSLGAVAATAGLVAGGASVLRGLIVFNAASYLAAGVSCLLLPRRSGGGRSLAGRTRHRRWVLDWRYLGASMLCGTLFFQGDILSVGLPLWIVHSTHAPAALAAALLLVNTAVVVLFQVRVSAGVCDLPTAWTAAMRCGLVMLAACGVCILSAGASGVMASAILVLAVVLLSLGELWGAAAGWAISYDLADPHRQGEYLGMWSLGGSLVGVAGPALVAVLIIHGGRTGWGVLGMLFFASFAVQAFGGRRRWFGTSRIEPAAGVVAAPLPEPAAQEAP